MKPSLLLPVIVSAQFIFYDVYDVGGALLLALYFVGYTVLIFRVLRGEFD